MKRLFTGIVVNAAAVLLESAPFVLAGVLAARIPLRAARTFAAYFGCGCGTGPSARSLPAFAATWFGFGPAVACARLAAAIAVERALRRRECAHQPDEALAQFAAIAPFAVAGAALVPAFPAIAGAHASHLTLALSAALAAFLTSPCAVGAVGIAAMLRTAAPAAAIGFLCIAGIADLRAWIAVRSEGALHDCSAYGLAALACALAALRGGAAMVNPRFVPALWLCAAVFAFLAFVYRTHVRARLRIAPAIMLAGCCLSAPLPAIVQTETTLSDAYPGERVDFTGAVVRTAASTSLVRYAVTCCRADAAPIVLQLDSRAELRSPWARARGVLVRRGDSLELHARTIEAIPPPADPFVYR
jgi:hypothetical protein